VGLPFELPVVLAALVGLIVTGLALTFAQRSLVLAYSYTRFIEAVTATFVEGFIRSSWNYASGQTAGGTMNQLTIEVRRSGRALTHLLTSLAAAIQIAIFLALSLTIFWELVLVALVFGIVAVIVIRPFQHRSFRYGGQLTEANSAFASETVDLFRNFKLVKVTGSENLIAGRLKRLQRNVCRVIRLRQVNYAATEFVIQIFPVLLVAGVIGVAHGLLRVETAPVLVFLLFLARMVPLITQCQQEYQSYVMDLPAIHLIDSIVAEQHRNRAEPPPDATAFTRLEDGIRFENVSYRFPGVDDEVLEDINLTIGYGQMVAIVGGSGAGKSTLIDLLCGLRTPTSGRILLDGRDLADTDSASWRRWIGYVTQDIAVFNDSLRNNIRFARPEATAEDVRRAVDIAHLGEVIDAMPEGLDTIVGEGGVRLSGGQKQRLALARALMGNPQLLLLDEATSALDNESERLVQRSIERLAHEFTLVVVAHRLSTVRQADLICVLERGRIVEMDRFDALLERKGRFAELYALQFS
jgi:ABC-type multidrug transport system fused ATPase/permease subunit